MKKLMTRKQAKEPSKSAEKIEEKAEEKPKALDQSNNVTQDATKDSNVSEIDKAMKQLSDEFGKMFTQEELLYELEKANKDVSKTSQVLIAKRDERIETKNRHLFQKIKEEKKIPNGETIAKDLNSKDTSQFSNILQHINYPSTKAQSSKIKIPHKVLSTIVDNFKKPSPDSLINSRRQ